MNEFMKFVYWLRNVSNGMEVTDYRLLVEMYEYLKQKWFEWYMDLTQTDDRKYQVCDTMVFEDLMDKYDVTEFTK